MTLYCATSNAGKLREWREALADYELKVIDLPPCEETGATFEENACQKAIYYSRSAPGLLFAEDSGLEVDALGGAPGVYSARFAQCGAANPGGEPAFLPALHLTEKIPPEKGATDDDNNRLLLEKLHGVADRTARYVCVVAVAEAGAVLQTFRGEVAGKLIDTPRGTQGFGYDPYFFYEPFQSTFAEASTELKRTVSHRGRALAAMRDWLNGRK